MKKYFSFIFLVIVIIYFLYLIKPALENNLTGTFHTVKVSEDYKKLEVLLTSDTSFSRTLWIPVVQRFAHYSKNHPSVSSYDLYEKNDIPSIVNLLSGPEAEKTLQDLSIKYVIVPNDTQGEIFLTDRKYDDKQYVKTVNSLKGLEYLTEIEGFDKLKVFVVSEPKPHFWSPTNELTINIEEKNPTYYLLDVKNLSTDDIIVFTDSYDKNWVAQTEETNLNLPNKQFEAQKNPPSYFNSFTPGIEGDYKFKITYSPQQWVNLGMAITTLTLIVVFCLLVYRFLNRNKKG